METYILLQDRHAPQPNRGSQGIIAAAFKTLAAVSATATLLLAILPPSDAATVQQTLAIAAMHPDGAGHPGGELARA
jgi:hypothetical protein